MKHIITHHIGSSCQQWKQKNWNHHLHFYISMYIHYMIHLSINFPPSRKMNIKHFSRFTSLAIWAYSCFFQFFDVTFALLSALIFTHKTPNHLRSPAQHGTSSLTSAWSLPAEQRIFAKKYGKIFEGWNFLPRFFLWNACLVNVLAKGFALLIKVGGELQWQTINHQPR